MRRTGLVATGLMTLGIFAGCAMDPVAVHRKPLPAGPLVDLEYPQDIKGGPGLPINDKQELDLVEPLIENRVMYARYLKVLVQYYDDHGFLSKRRWASTELSDLRQVPTFSYGADVGQLKLRDIQVAGQQEIDLVERLSMHRKMYNRLLNVLVRYYSEKENREKQACAEREREDLSYVKPYQYLMSATIPIKTLRPQESIAEADRLYDDGLKLLKKGGYGTPAMYVRRTMKQALNKFHTLLVEYPTSDKIAEAAWWAGYIHKEYFYDVAQQVDDNEIAVQYFERAWTWKPDIRYQVRFEAATVYDYRMHDRERALRLYQEVIDKEAFVESNVNFAHRRIRQLLKDTHELAPAEPEHVVKAPGVEPATAMQASPPTTRPVAP